MVDEASVSVEEAAVMLNTDMETLLAEALELGIALEQVRDFLGNSSMTSPSERTLNNTENDFYPARIINSQIYV